MLNDKKNQNDHLKWVKLFGAMADIINLVTSKLEFFLYYDFVKNAQAKSFQDQKIISLKRKSSIILISVKIINLFHKMKYKVVIGIISVVQYLLLLFSTRMRRIVFDMNHLLLYLITWIMTNMQHWSSWNKFLKNSRISILKLP